MPTTVDRSDALVERLLGGTLGALEQQAVAGLLDVEAGDERRYALPADHARMLANTDDVATRLPGSRRPH